MKELEMIDMLRHALACIWTGMEHLNDLSEELCQIQYIADEALNLSIEYAPKHKTPSNEMGVEAWEEYKVKKYVIRH